MILLRQPNAPKKTAKRRTASGQKNPGPIHELPLAVGRLFASTITRPIRSRPNFEKALYNASPLPPISVADSFFHLVWPPDLFAPPMVSRWPQNS